MVRNELHLETLSNLEYIGHCLYGSTTATVTRETSYSQYVWLEENYQYST